MAGKPVRGAGRVPPATAITEKRRPLIVLRPFSRWRIRASAVVSILVHVLIFALLLPTIRREEAPEELPPPSPVAMVFEHGRKEGPSVPTPTPGIKPLTPP